MRKMATVGEMHMWTAMVREINKCGRNAHVDGNGESDKQVLSGIPKFVWQQAPLPRPADIRDVLGLQRTRSNLYGCTLDSLIEWWN